MHTKNRIISVFWSCNIGQRELYLSKSTIVTTTVATEMNSDVYCLQKRIEKFPLSGDGTGFSTSFVAIALVNVYFTLFHQPCFLKRTKSLFCFCEQALFGWRSNFWQFHKQRIPPFWYKQLVHELRPNKGYEQEIYWFRLVLF